MQIHVKLQMLRLFLSKVKFYILIWFLPFADVWGRFDKIILVKDG
jgi:hypothetical protein